MKVMLLVVTATLFSGGVAATKKIDTGAASAPRAEAARKALRATAFARGVEAPDPWAPQDPADSLYRLANAALSRGDNSRAAELFARIAERYPDSEYAGRALYYAAFAMYRVGGTEKLRNALTALNRLSDRYPDVASSGDAKQLQTRVCGELAKRGDERCARDIAALANPNPNPNPRSNPNPRPGRDCPSADDEDDERITALNALLQMDADRAMPILKQVIARRDACSIALRRKAMFLVSQKRTSETADILLSAARNDPDKEVREQAVFWLSQVPDERAVDMLQDILRNSRDEDLQNKALFALSQHRSGRGQVILRDFARREDVSDELRGQAIFWLGQRATPETRDFLKSLFAQTKSEEMKDKILFSLSQQKGVGNDRFLLDVASNTRETVEVRKKALFWAGQGGVSGSELISLYSRMPESEMREQLIFVYSQRRDEMFVDKLMDIAKNDRDPELRKKAIFWLGQSRNSRVQQFLLDLINR
ncbi:MAG TPA: HEAT repeat domain-containing protein [Gemmatimonadaceae bacterium]|jgi:HEAT repeat protein